MTCKVPRLEELDKLQKGGRKKTHVSTPTCQVKTTSLTKFERNGEIRNLNEGLEAPLVARTILRVVDVPL
jgi:hypothetical protein